MIAHDRCHRVHVTAPRVALAEPPCAADMRKLCADVPVGAGRVQACLKAHESELSEACRSRVDDLARDAKTLAAICRWDIGRFCSDVTPGRGQVLACLEKNESELDPVCKEALRKRSDK